MDYLQPDVAPISIVKSNNISIFEYPNSHYEVIFHRGTHEAVDEWLVEISKINARYSSTQIVRYVVNTAQTGNEQVPIFYTFRRSQEFVRAHPERPITRTLVFHAAPENHALIAILNIFTSWLNGRTQESARFLNIQNTKAGMEWLMGE